jgi:hypothetical protein
VLREQGLTSLVPWFMTIEPAVSAAAKGASAVRPPCGLSKNPAGTHWQGQASAAFRRAAGATGKNGSVSVVMATFASVVAVACGGFSLLDAPAGSANPAPPAAPAIWSKGTSPVSGLSGHWRMDEGHGTLVENSASGVLVNGPRWTSGRHGTAIRFDGDDDYVQLPDVVPAEAFTITFWMKPAAATWSGVLLDATRFPTYFFVDGTQSELRWFFESVDDADVQIRAPCGFEAGTWYHVAVTGRFGSSGPHRLYLDAVQQGESTQATNVRGALNPMRIGNSTDAYGSRNTGFPGTIDDLRIYPRVLSPSEIAGLARRESSDVR